MRPEKEAEFIIANKSSQHAHLLSMYLNPTDHVLRKSPRRKRITWDKVPEGPKESNEDRRVPEGMVWTAFGALSEKR